MNPDPVMLAAECVAVWAIVLLPVFWWRSTRQAPAQPAQAAPAHSPPVPAEAIRDTQPYERSGAVTVSQGET